MSIDSGASVGSGNGGKFKRIDINEAISPKTSGDSGGSGGSSAGSSGSGGSGSSSLPEYQECRISNLYWDREGYAFGEIVGLVAEVSDCDGNEVKFEIREDDFLFSQFVQNINSSSSISNGVAKAFWKVPLISDGVFGGKPEFYFIANVSGTNSRKSSLNFENGVLNYSGINESYCFDSENLTGTGGGFVLYSYNRCNDGKDCGEILTFFDSCISSSVLLEYSCIDGEVKNEQAGCLCINSRCIKEILTPLIDIGPI